MDSSSPSPVAPRRALLAEEAFAQALGVEGRDFQQAVARIRGRAAEGWKERDLYALYRQSTDLERYLDHHGAVDNRAYALLRELLARCRWLALACSTLVHLRGRLGVYPDTPERWTAQCLRPRLEKAISTLAEILLANLDGLQEQWLERTAPWPEVEPVEISQPPPRPMLAADLVNQELAHMEASQGEMPAAARWVWRAQQMRQLLPAELAKPPQEEAAISSFCRDHLREAQVRKWEAQAHNLQSDYDTQIRESPEAEAHETLPMLRGLVSQGLHLFEAATALAHLMERHEGFRRLPTAAPILARYLSWGRLKALLVQDLAGLAFEAFEVLQKPAKDLIQVLTKPSFIELELPEDVTIHARPLSLLVRVVNHFETPVELEIEGQRASAASMMAMLVLVGSHPNHRRLRFFGDQRALAAIESLVEAGLGERGLEALPESLDFLRS